MADEFCDIAVNPAEHGWFRKPPQRQLWDARGSTRQQVPKCAYRAQPDVKAKLAAKESWSSTTALSSLLDQMWQWPVEAADVAVDETEPLPDRFRRLADEWSQDIGNVSSLTAMASHPAYRTIIDIGWDVVPLLLTDLKRNNRFWLPALHEITGIQPFDPSDAGNTKRMVRAWIQWGENKYERHIE